jgi:hypothetical protein
MYMKMYVYLCRDTFLNTDVCDKSIFFIEEFPFSPVLINYVVNTVQFDIVQTMHFN